MARFTTEDEEHKIISGMRRDKKYPAIQQRIFVSFLSFIVVMFLCTFCNCQIASKTWKCKGCGYENYTGIRYCGLCGREKGK